MFDKSQIFNYFSFDRRVLFSHSEDFRVIRRVPGVIGYVRPMCTPLPDSPPSMVSQWQRTIGYSDQGVADDSRGYICARSFVALTRVIGRFIQVSICSLCRNISILVLIAMV